MAIETKILGDEGSVYPRLIRGGLEAVVGEPGEFNTRVRLTTERTGTGGSVVKMVNVEYPVDMDGAPSPSRFEPGVTYECKIDPPYKLSDVPPEAITQAEVMARSFGAGVLEMVERANTQTVFRLDQQDSRNTVTGDELAAYLNTGTGDSSSV